MFTAILQGTTPEASRRYSFRNRFSEGYIGIGCAGDLSGWTIALNNDRSASAAETGMIFQNIVAGGDALKNRPSVHAVRGSVHFGPKTTQCAASTF
jgi:hypothetical protein